MGKKDKEGKQRSEEEENQEKGKEDIEGKFLLGKPKFKKLENGRYKCVQTGHELPADARESYALTKHCRLGLIDSALARNKPPLNMFSQDPNSRSKLICKLTGDSVNKTEEHIWKHINGRRFLHMLEKQEAEAEAGKKESDELMEEESEQKPEKASKSNGDGLKEEKKKKKKKKKEDKKKKKKKKHQQEEEDVSKIISEVRDTEDKDSDTEEEEFWMPPVGERWDFDDGGDRWGSGSDADSDSGPEIEDANEADAAGKESNNDAGEISKRTKRMSIEVGPSDSAPKKKKKIEST